MGTDQNRVNNLTEYVHGLMNMENGKELYLKYKSDIEKVTPQEVFQVFYNQLEKGEKPGDVLTVLDKVINVFYKSLFAYSWNRPEKNTFVDYLMQENHALAAKLDGIKNLIKDRELINWKAELLPGISELSGFNEHYLKKENILFPYMEKKMKKFDGLSIMWALHDETRECLKKVIDCLTNEECTREQFNTEVGRLFFAMYGLIQKEELILFPAAGEIINKEEWVQMQKQSLEYGFPFIQKPGSTAEHGTAPEGSEITEQNDDLHIKTETGVLTLEQMKLVFDNLPVDLTFVDENNKVRYFNNSKDRLFPRSPAVIGREVEKCHPPESVHVVNEIITSFREGTQDNAKFWIQIKHRMILIQYFALRDTEGKYRGILEVSQDITGIRELDGERRLLHWGK